MKRLREWESRYNPQSRSAANMQELLLSVPLPQSHAYIDDVFRRLTETGSAELAAYVLAVVAPLANRLNLQKKKHDLENEAFRILHPQQYDLTVKLLHRHHADRDRDVLRIKQTLTTQLQEKGLGKSRVEARTKQPYSLYKKLSKTGTISDVHDLLALRIVTATKTECYSVLDIVHETYDPVLERFKDYIKQPKPNGYQSLHTTLTVGKRRAEIQIRTHDMHRQAEGGEAAHWHYDTQKDTKEYRRGRVSSAKSKQERRDLYVFSPTGDVYRLPAQATPIDFAFAVHSHVGMHTQGARINGRLAKLNTPLQAGDEVEIITSHKASPKRHWLRIVYSSKARQRIRAWLKQLEYDRYRNIGKQRLTDTFGDSLVTIVEEYRSEHGYTTIDDIFVAVGGGHLHPDTLRRHHKPRDARASAKRGSRTAHSSEASGTGRRQVLIAGMEGLAYRLANCCRPQSGDEITGYITRSLGITVHRSNCSQIESEAERHLEAWWVE